MATTLNISLTKQQVNWINRAVKKWGFANRSEFFRALIRWLSQPSEAMEKVSNWPFFPPSTRNKEEILAAFKKSGRYSKEFLKDLEEGLEGSGYFK